MSEASEPAATTDDGLGERPPEPSGAVRRIGRALLGARLFGGPPPRLGRFEVTRKLGEGGMGVVFEAVDPDLGRTVALKLLRHPERRALTVTIQNEARMLARLSHPNVVTVHELGSAEGEQYVCMERVDGPHLAAWIAIHPEASWRAVLAHLVAAARGLAAAHAAGVIHRDFKLENVLVGADGVPRVTDFGLARSEGQEGPPHADAPPASGLRSSWAGTPGCIAPEVLAGQPATERSDQYSFFVAVERALAAAGHVPGGELAGALRRGTASDPAARFADLGAVVEALEGVLAARPAEDARARAVLAERVERLWVTPLRARALAAVGAEFALPCEPAPELAPDDARLALGDCSAAAVAAALHGAAAAVILVGAPGSGKSLRLLAVAAELLRRARDQPDATLPVVLNLSSFAADERDLEGWVVRELIAKYALPRRQVERWLEVGQLALLLDGLDEVPGPTRSRCVLALDAFRARRPVPFLVTCREDNYRALNPRVRADAVLRLGPLPREGLQAVLDRAPARLRALVASDPALAEQLQNPLLLTLFSQAAAEGHLDGASAATLRERLYGAALEHALDRAPPLSGPERQRARAALVWLAGAMERVGVTELWLEELQAAWLPSRGQRIGAVGLGVVTAFGLSIAVNGLATRLSGQPWFSGLFFGVIAAAAAFVIQGGARVVPMEAMRWSWARVRQWIPRNLALGLGMGLLHGLFYDLLPDLVLGVATGLLGLSVIGLVPAGRERRASPGEGLRESLRNSLLVAPVIGVTIGVPIAYLALPLARPLASPESVLFTHPDAARAWGVTLGTSAAVTSLYITGFLAPVLHGALRVVLALTSPLPLRLVPWLEGLADRDLLHRVGGGWQFRHASFRAWLAAGAPAPPDADARAPRR